MLSASETLPFRDAAFDVVSENPIETAPVEVKPAGEHTEKRSDRPERRPRKEGKE